jgi:hypothetical protein
VGCLDSIVIRLRESFDAGDAAIFETQQWIVDDLVCADEPSCRNRTNHS